MQQRAQPVYARLVLIGIRIRRVNRIGAGQTMMIWSSRGVKMTRRNFLDADEFDLPRERLQTNNSARLASAHAQTRRRCRERKMPGLRRTVGHIWGPVGSPDPP